VNVYASLVTYLVAPLLYVLLPKATLQVEER